MKISKTLKTAAVILILCAGLIGSHFIVKNSGPKAETERQNTSEQSGPMAQNPIEWIKENIGGVLDKIDGLNQLDLSEKSPPENLTAAFSEIVFEQIKSKNEQGLTQKDGQMAVSAASEEVIYQEWLNEFLSGNASRPSALYHPKVIEENMAISDDISSENQIQYLKNLENISKNSFSGFTKTNEDILDEIIQKRDFSSARQLAGIYGKIADDSNRISVPKNWIDFHKSFLSHFYSSESVWSVIADSNNDPLKTYLIAEQISNLKDSALGLQILMAEEISKNNLSFQ